MKQYLTLAAMLAFLSLALASGTSQASDGKCRLSLMSRIEFARETEGALSLEKHSVLACAEAAYLTFADVSAGKYQLSPRTWVYAQFDGKAIGAIISFGSSSSPGKCLLQQTEKHIASVGPTRIAPLEAKDLSSCIHSAFLAHMDGLLDGDYLDPFTVVYSPVVYPKSKPYYVSFSFYPQHARFEGFETLGGPKELEIP
jgi:hypothetical protein